jgi:hypothetical protein
MCVSVSASHDVVAAGTAIYSRLAEDWLKVEAWLKETDQVLHKAFHVTNLLSQLRARHGLPDSLLPGWQGPSILGSLRLHFLSLTQVWLNAYMV